MSSRNSLYEHETSDYEIEIIGDMALYGDLTDAEMKALKKKYVDVDEENMPIMEATSLDSSKWTGLSPADSRRLAKIGARQSAAQIFADRRKSIFIQTLASTGVVGRAATAAGWTRKTAYSMKQRDPIFSQVWDDALEFAADGLEEAARRRAVDGVIEPVYQKGHLVGYVTKYSDSLLIQLLKAKRPKEFRENSNFNSSEGSNSGVLVVPGVESYSSWAEEARTSQLEYRSDVEVGNGDIIEVEAVKKGGNDN